VEEGVAAVVRDGGFDRGLIKIMAYWGQESVIALVLDAKLDLAICGVPSFEELALDRAEPVEACFSRWRKIRPDMIPSEAKACANYLNGYLARKDALERGFHLGILLTHDGYVAEGSIESVFMVEEGVLKTPPTGNILRSITRMSILEAASANGMATAEEPITPEQMLAAEEIFTCHTGIKVLPVKRIEDRILHPVPGPITEKAMAMMDTVCSGRDERFRGWFQPMG
jgi:branched-chain amino acid aminotransferase